MTIECDGASDDLAIAPIMALPKIVGQDSRGRAAAPVIIRRKCTSQNGPDSEGMKKVATDHTAVGAAHLTARCQIEPMRAPGEDAGKHVLMVANLLPDRVGKGFAGTNFNL